MNTIIPKLLIGLALVTNTFISAEDIILLTYGKCGTHVVQKMMTFLKNDQQNIRHDHLYNQIALLGNFFVKRLKIKPDSKLIILYRNPLECIPSLHERTVGLTENNFLKDHLPENPFCDENEYLSYEYKRYNKILEYYNKWPYQKLLISYENLVSNPAEIASEISCFLEGPQDNLENFIENQEEILESVCKTYDQRFPESPTITQGKDLNFFQKILNWDQKVHILLHLYEENQDIFKTYIKKYLPQDIPIEYLELKSKYLKLKAKQLPDV